MALSYTHLSRENLGVLDNTDLSSAHSAAVQSPSLALGVHNSVILLANHWGHEHSLMLVWIELLVHLWVDALQSVLLEGVHEDTLGHSQALVKRDEILDVLVLLDWVEFLLWHDGESAVKVIDGLDEVLGEFL